MRIIILLLTGLFLSHICTGQKKMSRIKQEIIRSVENNKTELTELSDKIWALAETAFEETESARLLADFVKLISLLHNVI